MHNKQNSFHFLEFSATFIVENDENLNIKIVSTIPDWFEINNVNFNRMYRLEELTNVDINFGICF